MDAEYGNALSGVVAVSTKEGTEKFGGEVRWDTDRYGDPTKTFDNYDRFTFGFGGPTPVQQPHLLRDLRGDVPGHLHSHAA